MIRFPFPAQQKRAPGGYATIALSEHQSAQGPILRKFRDGRVVIDTGRGNLTGHPLGVEHVPFPIWSPIFMGM